MNPKRLLALGAALLLCVGLLGASAAADCGGVHVATPKKKRTWRLTGTHKPPLAIGDSTMLFALPPLRRAGFRANARGCRRLPEGVDILKRLHRNRAIPHLTVIALGADGTLSPHGLERALRLIGRHRLLALVVPLELGGGTGSDAVLVKKFAHRHPHRVRALDWPRFSSKHPEWFAPDGLHVGYAGARGFARLIKRVRPFARPGRFFG